MQTLLKNTSAYQLLLAQQKSARIGHAYLLTLDDARNLLTAGKVFAKLLFGCADGSRVSNLIDRQTFADCLFFPQTDKKFSVDDAVRLGEECLLQPVECDKKVFVISNFAEANVPSQNKLLKLLEQPPEGVIFLLCATSSHPILPTVLSRVEKLEIAPFSVQDVQAFLTRTYGEKYNSQEIELCASACGGKIEMAQSLLEDGGHKSLLFDAFALASAPANRLPLLSRKLGDIKQKKEFLSLLRIVYRDALLYKTGQREYVLLRLEEDSLKKLASVRTTAALLYAQERLTVAEQELTFNAVFAQCIETFATSVLQKNNG